MLINAILVMSFTAMSGLVASWPEKGTLREQAMEAVPEKPRLVDVLVG
jgi:hypothetical protein